MRTLRLDGPWRRIVHYPDRHLNDFCLFRDRDGVWHAIGIVGTGTWDSEQTLFHAVGDDLEAPFTPLPDVLAEPAAAGVAPQKHAPFVICREGVYHLFYRRPPGTILQVCSDDPYTWKGLGEVVFARRDARDVCIVEVDGQYRMIYCQSEIVDGVPRSAILARRSADLSVWSAPEVLHVDTARPAEHSYLESPYLVPEGDGWYLFCRHRLLDDRRATTVYWAETPDRFPSGERAWCAEIPNCHAPEIVRSGDHWYIARVSGPPHAGPGGLADEGWVDVARLTFD